MKAPNARALDAASGGFPPVPLRLVAPGETRPGDEPPERAHTPSDVYRTTADRIAAARSYVAGLPTAGVSDWPLNRNTEQRKTMNSENAPAVLSVTAASYTAGGGLPEPYFEGEGVTLYHADARLLLPALGRFDLLLTDPPYGIGFAAQPTLGQRRAGKAPETWDDATPAVWMLGLAREITAEQVIWGGNYFGLPASRCWLSWHKPDAPPSMSNVEYAWTSWDRNSAQMSRSISATNRERVGHPTQKPLDVMKWCLGFAPDAATVLDPFAGSGTTLVAAKELGRRAVGIEMNERYCELAADRLRQHELFPRREPAV